MIRILLGAILAFALFTYRSLNGSLDGSAWEVSMRRETFFALPHRDTLIFDGGRFTSIRRLRDGFLPGGYSAQGKKASALWQASLSGEDGDNMEWQGHVDGDRMEGTVTWTRHDGSTRHFKFRGRRK